MDHLEADNLKVHLYDEDTTIRQIAAEKVKVQTDPTREDPDDPFFIFDIGDVIAKDNKWTNLLPSVEPFYAVKSNPDPIMVKLMVGFGRGFDCASKKEIQLVLDSGASPDKIIFAHPCKQESHLRFAKEKGVRLMTFDTEEELYKVKKVHPEAQLVLRVLYVSNTAIFPSGTKFGCHEQHVHPLMTLAKELALNIVGISFYIGSELYDPNDFAGAIRYVKPMFDLGRTLGFSMNLLDIGGGLPGRLRPKTKFEEFAEIIEQSLGTDFPPSTGVRVIAEPGTFYTRSAGFLLANIIAKRVYKKPQVGEKVNDGADSEESTIWMYYLNVGIYNSLMMSVLDQSYQDTPEPLKVPDENVTLKLSCVWGPTCDSGDVLFTRCMLPEMDAGDFVIISDTGGYSTTCSSGFNGYCCPPTCFIAPKKARSLIEKIFTS